MNYPDEEDFSRPSEIIDLPESPPYYCPVCGEEVARFYASTEGLIVGCDNCVASYNPYPRLRKCIRRYLRPLE